MTLTHPTLLWSLPLLSGLLALALGIRGLRAHRVRGYLNGHPGAEFWPRVPASPAMGGWWKIRGLLLLLSGSLLGLVLAGPQAGTREVPFATPVEPLILVLDVSRSMEVRDVPQGRLNAARLAARRVVGHAGRVPIGLVIFAGEAYGVLPPSTDRDLLFGYLDAANPEMLTRQGTALAPALKAAMALGGSEGSGFGALLLSDGEGHGDKEEVLGLARGIRGTGGWVAGISQGTESGGELPMTGSLAASLRIEGSGAETENGVPRSRSRPAFLAEVAEAGGGAFALGSDASEMSSLMDWVGNWVADQESGVELMNVPVEAWPWFLALAIGGLLLESALGGASSRKDQEQWS